MVDAGRDSLCRSVALGLVFITLGSCRVLLIKFSANEDGKYEYLPVTVNFCAEVLKLLICITLALQYLFASGYKWRDYTCPAKAELLSISKWAIPGFLYFLDNLLAFYIVKNLQPAMAVLLGNFGIITTSILFRLILKRKMTRVQWASLAILFLAIVCLSHQSQGSISIEAHKHHAVNHILPVPPESAGLSILSPASDLCHPEETSIQPVVNSSLLQEVSSMSRAASVLSRWNVLQLHRGHAFVALQCLISSLANVYNEKIFKDGSGMEESIYLQNCKLYAFGVFFNLLTLLNHEVYRKKLLACGFFHGHNTFSIGLIFITAMYGLNVAFILKFRDNMFHLLSSQLITVIVTSASIYFFQFQPEFDFYLTAPIVLAVIYIYHMSRHKEELPVTDDLQRRRIRFMHEVDEGDGFIIAPGPLQE